MKKIISSALCIITCFLIFTLCTPVTFAASYNGACGDGITWSLNTSDGVLTISGSGSMNNYSISSTPGWDRYQSYIKSVVFARGVKSVGDYTFCNGGNGYKYKKLKAVDLGNVNTIGKYAFRGCGFIDTITNAGNVTVINDYAFLSCSSLTTFPFSAVETINNCSFSGCSGLTTLNLPSSLKTIGSAAFEKCSSVSAVTLPGSVTSIGDIAFSECTGITSVIFNSANVAAAGSGIFEGSGVKDGATLTISDSVTVIPADMFSFFANLTAVQGGANITTISDNAFAHTGLISFRIGPKVVTVKDSAFADTTSLASFTVDSYNANYSVSSSGILMNKAGNKIVRYPCAKTDTSYTVPSNVTTVAAGAFRECMYLKNFTAGSSVSAIPDYCFINSPMLTTVSLASSVKTIGSHAFADCKSLNTISMNGVSTVNQYAFAQCDALPSFTTSSNLKSIGDYAYYGCDGIISLTIASGTTSIGTYSFCQCDNLRELSIASTVTNIPDGAFSSCTSLSSLSLPGGLKTVGKYAFAECTALMSVTVPSSVTSIGQFAFGYKNINGSSASIISGFKLYCYSGSQAYTYARNGGIPYEIVTNSEGELIITDADASVSDSSGGFSEFIQKLSIPQLPFINWILSVISKIHSFFAGLVSGKI